MNVTLDYKTLKNFLNKSVHFHLQKKDTVKRLEKEYQRLTKLEDFSGQHFFAVIIIIMIIIIVNKTTGFIIIIIIIIIIIGFAKSCLQIFSKKLILL